MLNSDRDGDSGWALIRQTWEVSDVPPGTVAGSLSEEFEQASTGSDTVESWRFSPDLIWNREIRISLDYSSGEIDVVAYGTQLAKRLCQFLIITAPLLFIPQLLYSTPLLTWWGRRFPLVPDSIGKYAVLVPYLLVAAYLAPLADVSRHDEVLARYSLQIEERRGPYLYIITLIILLFVWSYLRTRLPTIIADGAIAVLATVILFLLYQTTADKASTIQTWIPVIGLFWLLWPLSIVFSATLVTGLPESLPGQTRLLVKSGIAMILGLFFTVFGTIELLNLSNTLYTSIQRSKITPFESRIRKHVVQVFYLLANIALLAGAAVTLNILYYSLTEQFFFAEQILSSYGITTPISQGYLFYRSFFQSLPLLPVKTYLFIFELVLLTPFLLIAWMWAFNFSTQIWMKWRVLNKSETVSQSYETVPRDIEVRKASQGTPAAPVTLFLGFKKYIILDEQFIDEAETKGEIEALLAHEVYHLENRDFLVNTVAAVTSLFFGGKNALLAFYDYPEKEREADRYAAGKTSRDDLINGIETSYRFVLEDDRHPDTRDTKPLSFRPPTTILSEGAIGAVKHDFQRMFNWVLRTYLIFFGDVLFAKAHLNRKNRIEYIEEIE
ncbi:MAG: M48 family metalloprotease [Candidatus Aenigmatarchaeota archaeon]